MQAAGLQPVDQVHVLEREVEEGVRGGLLQHAAVIARLQRHHRRQPLGALGVLGSGGAQPEEAAPRPPAVAALLPHMRRMSS